MLEQKYLQYEKNIRSYVKKHVETVLKQPREFIHYPFIDPGSVYDGNVWDWDTFWSVYALLGMMEEFDQETRERIIVHAKGNIQNFLDHQLEDGYIPMMIEVLDWAEPYLNMKHKEGVLMNMHKPFLCQQICLISDYVKDYTWVQEEFCKLEKYFECYDKYYLNENCGLYVWQDDIMIGMDNDPATFGRPKASTANIFLNSFMVEELHCMAKIAAQWGKSQEQQLYITKAENLVRAIQEECWDKRDEFFYSVDVDICTRKFDWFHQGMGVFWKTLPIKIRVWSGFIPMWAGFATEKQAAALSNHWKDASTFGSPYGVCTLSKDEKMYCIQATNNPSDWLGPIWLVANYVVFQGLLRYGYREDAEELCRRTLLLLGEDLEKTGELHEYYDPSTGKPVMNGGFLNWNILAVNMVRDLYGENRDKN